MEFGGSSDQNGENCAGNVHTTGAAEAPNATLEFDEDLRHDQASRSDNNAHLMEGIVDASLINQLEGEMTMNSGLITKLG